ncbi:MAG TPA: TPM domain-containing protein [Caulobacteraceae bacterium]|nr:TPM domain-containing protein [Caulobacteraceae bacterium]
MLSANDHARIAAAVAKAEEGTRGDIFCVLAGEVSSYRETPIAWGAAAALLLPPAVLAVGLHPLLAAITGGGWTAAQAGAFDKEVAFVLTGYAVAQWLLFGIVALITSIGPVRRAVTPRFLKRHRVKKAAYHHFAAARAHARDSETGVLIFVALVERQVQVLADAAIHAKAGDAVWAEAAAAVQAGMGDPDPTAGIERAIAICGEALKTYFPADGARAETDTPLDD